MFVWSMFVFIVIIRLRLRSTRTDTLLPYTTLFRSGGEVTLRKDFVEVAHAVIDNCPDLLLLHFPTNGYLSDKIVENTRAIMARRPEKLIITVSTDGDEQMNDEFRGIQGGWQRPIETFRRLRQIRSDEHKSELQPLMRSSYAVLCWKNKNRTEQAHP